MQQKFANSLNREFVHFMFYNELIAPILVTRIHNFLRNFLVFYQVKFNFFHFQQKTVDLKKTTLHPILQM